MNTLVVEEFVPTVTVCRKEYAFQPKGLALIEERGYKLIKRIGSGSTSFVFLAIDEKHNREVAVVIPVFGSDPESLEWIVKAQNEGKLRDVCTLYETFPIENLLCEELREEERNEKTWEDSSEPMPLLLDVHHVQVVELLTILNVGEEYCSILDQLNEITERMFEEGYMYTDIHSDNLAYNLQGELKFIDLMSVILSPEEDKLKARILKCAPALLDTVDNSGLGFVYNYYYRILEGAESVFTL